uniref:Uncharacterized protein n=1 Tax=viral metagenome TaxID=1070528 RepID=A0A6C0CDC0_9ZZZZ
MRRYLLIISLIIFTVFISFFIYKDIKNDIINIYTTLIYKGMSAVVSAASASTDLHPLVEECIKNATILSLEVAGLSFNRIHLKYILIYRQRRLA